MRGSLKIRIGISDYVELVYLRKRFSPYLVCITVVVRGTSISVTLKSSSRLVIDDTKVSGATGTAAPASSGGKESRGRLLRLPPPPPPPWALALSRLSSCQYSDEAGSLTSSTVSSRAPPSPTNRRKKHKSVLKSFRAKIPQ